MRLLTAVSLVGLFIATDLPAQQIVGRKDRSFSLDERVPNGNRLTLATRNGALTVTESADDMMHYRAEKTGGDADDIGFVVRRFGGGLAVCAIFDEDSEECTEDGIRGRDRRGWQWNRNRARVAITVSVPKGVRLIAQSGNGDVSVSTAAAEARVASGNGKVRVRGVRGRVNASSGNGEVTIDDVAGPVEASSGNGDVSVGTVEGPVKASSGNGDILVSMERLAGSGDLDFSTGNGRIEVTLPNDFSGEVDANTGSGRITTDFPIRLTGRISPTRLRGTIGDGKRRLTMNTGNGSLELRRR